ncbi:hypothetical protein KFE98_01385 [bacterium SCSIO 12741]|nr:hypothetical protein KFE98_01385 [bacterium SCSIO 12741]
MKYLLLIIPIVCTLSLNAQIDSFRLDQVHNPDYKRKLLEFNFLLNQSNQNQFKTLEQESPIDNFRLSGRTGIDFYSIKNSTSYQGVQFGHLNLNGSAINGKNEGNVADARTFLTDATYESNNRFYHSDKGLAHLVFNPRAEINYMKRNGINDNRSNLSHSDQETSNYLFESDLGWGHGRLENVSDARTVLFILEDLRKNNLLLREPTQEEINELANLAIYVKNQRFFDSRIKRIYELTTLDSLLQQQGIVSESSIGYHTILQDNWNYSVNPFRQTGTLFQYGLRQRFFIENSTTNYLSRDSTGTDLTRGGQRGYLEEMAASFFVNFEYYRPLSQSLQNDVRIQLNSGLSGRYQTNDIYSINDEERTSQSENNLFYSLSVRDDLGIYPTNRTYISLWLEARYEGYISYEGTGLFDQEDRMLDQFTLSGGLSAYYYFSPQLRLSAEWGSNFNYFNTKQHDTVSEWVSLNEVSRWNNNFSLRLTYKLF